jgi:predicted nucleotidyltransferase
MTMDKSEIIATLRSYAGPIKASGAVSLYLFGSAARDEAGPRSDLDLFLDYDPQKKFSLVDLADIKLFLEDRLGIVVDITTRDSLHPMLRPMIEQSAVRVF